MRRIKNYSLTIAILLIITGSMALLYWFGFYKQFDKNNIPPNADGIVVADIKNIRNHFVFSYLKNPSQWEFSPNKFDKNQFDLSNYGIETPDYLAFFHIKNQPLNQWFISVKIENEAVFEKALAKAEFRKTILQNGMSTYFSISKMLFIIRYSNQILISNIYEKQRQIALKTAEDLFLKKLFLDRKNTEKIIGTSNAVTIWIKKNNLLDEDGIISINLKEREIIAEGKLKLHYKKEHKFLQNTNALLSLGFDFDMIRNLEFIKLNSDKINKMVGFDIDSVFVHNPTKTEFVLHNIIQKKDSAITYDYDDDFNPIKKMILHTSREPSFYFLIQSKDSKKIYNYLKGQNAIDSHEVFVNFPFAKTKTFIRENALTLEANLIKTTVQPSAPKIGYLQINFNKLQPKDWRYLMAKNKNLEFLKSFEKIELNLSQKKDLGYFEAFLKIRKEKKLIEIIE